MTTTANNDMQAFQGPKTEMLSGRVTPEDARSFDACARKLWRLERGPAMRKLVKALLADPQRMGELVDVLSYEKPDRLPKSYFYRVIENFTALVGITHYELKRGMILSLDGHAYAEIVKLNERGCKLQPMDRW
jgi:hypothetical protein